MVIDFWRDLAKIGIPHLHSVRCHFTMDGMITTWMHALTLLMTAVCLIKIGELCCDNPEFYRRRAGYTLGFAMHF